MASAKKATGGRASAKKVLTSKAPAKKVLTKKAPTKKVVAKKATTAAKPQSKKVAAAKRPAAARKPTVPRKAATKRARAKKVAFKKGSGAAWAQGTGARVGHPSADLLHQYAAAGELASMAAASEFEAAMKKITTLAARLSREAMRLASGQSLALGNKSAEFFASSVALTDLVGRKIQDLASSVAGLDLHLFRAAPTRRSSGMPALLRRTPRELKDAILADAAALEVVHELEAQTVFAVCARTVSGRRIVDYWDHRGPLPLEDLRLQPESANACKQRLTAVGCKVLDEGDYFITASAPASLIDDLFGTKLRLARSYLYGADRPPEDLAAELYVSTGKAPMVPGDDFHPSIDHILFGAAPASLATAKPIPHHEAPAAEFTHLTAADVRRRLNVPIEGPDADFRGRGTKFALIDTGFYDKHPFFATHRYLLEPRGYSTAMLANRDPSGHGTMMAWNVFAVAPECCVWGYKQSRAPANALLHARRAGAQVISISWGLSPQDGELLVTARAEIQAAIESGVIVVAACGNEQMAWPAVMPEVIAVGGMYFDPESESLTPSDFTQRGAHRDRLVPDVCGLCGNKPAGVYFPMPCPPGSEKDIRYGMSDHPNGDGLGVEDGWAYASGSSSATAQVAAVVALMVEKATSLGLKLSQEKVRKILKLASITSPEGDSVASGGLVDAARALAMVKAG